MVPADERAEELQGLREQRELALACLWLALTIAIAVPLSVFGDRREAWVQTNEAIQTHRKLLSDLDVLLSDNQKALHDVQQALQNLKVAPHH